MGVGCERGIPASDLEDLVQCTLADAGLSARSLAGVFSFVVALYNPASNPRRRGLARAIEILASKRTSATPVVVARAIGRDEQSVSVTGLQDLDQTSVDMMTLLIVGSTETRSSDGYVYTPRGYGMKGDSGAGA